MCSLLLFCSLLTRDVPVGRWQGLANFTAQGLGSVVGAAFLMGIFPCEMDLTTNLGTNLVSQVRAAGAEYE